MPYIFHLYLDGVNHISVRPRLWQHQATCSPAHMHLSVRQWGWHSFMEALNWRPCILAGWLVGQAVQGRARFAC